MKTQAELFREKHADTANLMTALDNANIESEQNWEEGTTVWTFEDGSYISVNGPTVDIFDKNGKLKT